MKISAVIIAKNEEAVIKDCLDSVSWFDEIILVDTGSEDRTVEIAAAYPNCRVFTDYKWNDDFAEARNHALSKATGDWVMQIDADHKLVTAEAIVRQQVETMNKIGDVVASIKLTHEPSKQSHNGAWLFKRSSDIFYVGAIHEVLSATSTHMTPIEQFYNKSPSHQRDPDRNLRILRKAPPTPRTRFYLGRELYERGEHAEAILHMGEYLKQGRWLPEICEAHLTLARCHWVLGDGNSARASTLEAVRNNPMFKEALLFMAELHYEPWKSRWGKLAAAANNDDVLFVRVQ